jgi:hypothetical protein
MFRGVNKNNIKRRTWGGGGAIIINKVKHYLGKWPNPEESACVYHCMAAQHFGDRAQLNFSDNDVSRTYSHRLV